MLTKKISYLYSYLTLAGVSDARSELCKLISPDALSLTDAFGLSDAMISAPIAVDWVNFNEFDNQGEV